MTVDIESLLESWAGRRIGLRKYFCNVCHNSFSESATEQIWFAFFYSAGVPV